MTVGASQATAGGWLSASFQATSYAVTNVWAKLHVGDPGGAGTSNPAGETTRKEVTACFGVAPAHVGNYMEIVNDAAMGPWVSVSTSEDYTHISFWTASTSGTFLGSGTVTSAAVTAADDWSVPIGDCIIRVPVAN